MTSEPDIYAHDTCVSSGMVAISENWLQIPLSKGYTAIVDSVDADLTDVKWNVSVVSNLCYAVRNVVISATGRKKELLHRVILSRMLERELAKGECVDHINGNGLDNRRCNLRLATHAENMHNRRRQKNNTSGFKGVSFHQRDQKWRSCIEINGARKTLGYFATAEEAYEAYCEAARKFHGAFARVE